MIAESIADSRAVAALLPTGPTVNQVKDRSEAAGTDGPPPQAANRVDQPDRARDADARPLALANEAPDDALARSVVETQLQQTDPADAYKEVVDDKTDQRVTDLAKAAFEETQFITRKAEEVRAANMRVAM